MMSRTPDAAGRGVRAQLREWFGVEGRDVDEAVK